MFVVVTSAALPLHSEIIVEDFDDMVLLTGEGSSDFAIIDAALGITQ